MVRKNAAERVLERDLHSAELKAKVVIQLIRTTGLVAICYIGYLAIDSLAGHTTVAQIVIDFMASVKINTAVAWGTTATAAVYGLVERRLRKRTVERLTRRTAELEARLDPNRTSSKLTSRGDTRPGD